MSQVAIRVSCLSSILLSLLVSVAPAASLAPAAETTPGPDLASTRPLRLHIIEFPLRKTVELGFTRHDGAPAAEVRAYVQYRDAQSRIDLRYRSMKPATLFGGDVTCYVLWAVAIDGEAENLGELLVRSRDQDLEFSTGRKAFALMITAESHYLVRQPSELVMFSNVPGDDRRAAVTDLEFKGLVPAPSRLLDGIADIRWDTSEPLDLLQARKVHELATRLGAARHATQAFQEAGEALAEAESIAADSPSSRRMIDQARRSVALSNVAINIALRRKESEDLEQQIAERRLEMAVMEQRARQAEVEARQAQTLGEELRAEMTRLRDEKERVLSETARLAAEKRSLELAMETMRQEKTALELNRRGLQEEKEQLSGRLQNALSRVAETHKTARGMVLSLPDILFDSGEATIKPDTRIPLAKLAGILLILPDLEVVIEGHTDATGSAEFNLALSRERAESVLEFLKSQEVAAGRLKAVGYGEQRPVADNRTASGRRRNRRVEIVIN
jgi:outer membrane protein OmpA-like peptidoglycan-associated protein